MKIPFFSFDKINQDIKNDVKNAFSDIFESDRYILGNYLHQFESKFSNYLNIKHSTGVGSGLDALLISLKSLGIGQNDEVIIPSHTFFATALAVLHAGARPILAEPDKGSMNVDPNHIERLIDPKTKAIIPVHLYGFPCDMDPLIKLSISHNIPIIEDFAQSVGASYKNQKCGSFGKINACSFYPVKTLGALGDGGAITTNDPDLVNFCRMYRNYGSSEKYLFEEAGINSRLDEIQAAILHQKLSLLDQWIIERKVIAEAYMEQLGEIDQIRLPVIPEHAKPAWHIFPVRIQKRDALQVFLDTTGIETMIHYPIPIHLQKGFYKYIKDYKKGDLKISEEIAGSEISLPIYPGLTMDNINQITDQIKRFIQK